MSFTPTDDEQSQIDEFLADLATAEADYLAQFGEFRRVRWGASSGLDALGVPAPATVLVRVEPYTIDRDPGYVVVAKIDRGDGQPMEWAKNVGPAAQDVRSHDWQSFVEIIPPPVADQLVHPFVDVAEIEERIAETSRFTDPDLVAESMALLRRKGEIEGG
jgi:hypothetical protein